MKLKNQIKIILTTFFVIAPIYSEQPLSQPTRFNVSRKTSLKDIAHEIAQINQQIDQLVHLRAHIKNQKEIAVILKDIDVLKTLRDLKIRELKKLRQQSFTQMKQGS